MVVKSFLSRREDVVTKFNSYSRWVSLINWVWGWNKGSSLPCLLMFLFNYQVEWEYYKLANINIINFNAAVLSNLRSISKPLTLLLHNVYSISTLSLYLKIASAWLSTCFIQWMIKTKQNVSTVTNFNSYSTRICLTNWVWKKRKLWT